MDMIFNWKVGRMQSASLSSKATQQLMTGFRPWKMIRNQLRLTEKGTVSSTHYPSSRIHECLQLSPPVASGIPLSTALAQTQQKKRAGIRRKRWASENNIAISSMLQQCYSQLIRWVHPPPVPHLDGPPQPRKPFPSVEAF